MPKRRLYRYTEEWREAVDSEQDRLLNMTALEVAEERQSVALLIDELLTDIAGEMLGESAARWLDESHPAWTATKKRLAGRLVRDLIARASAKTAGYLRRVIDDEADAIVAERERARREHVPDIVWEFERPIAA